MDTRRAELTSSVILVVKLPVHQRRQLLEVLLGVVERILDTPELWQTGAARGKGARSGTGAAGATGSRDADMPGSIDLRQEADDAEGGGDRGEGECEEMRDMECRCDREVVFQFIPVPFL